MKPSFPSLKTFLPEGAELMQHRYTVAGGQRVMSFGVLQPFALRSPAHDSDPGPLPDSLWSVVAEALGKDGQVDDGWAKERGEFLAVGACYPPPAHSGQPVSASISVGPLRKQLAVFGPRHYGVGGRITAPEPFHHMPLTLANAYGGSDFGKNPQGKGRKVHPSDAGTPIELPNIEYPDALIASASDAPPPATFGPWPADSAQRARFLGRHDTEWLKSRWPHLPEETDSRYFQAGSEDQWLDGFWEGGESILIRNMHPDHPDLAGTVPQARPRFFIHQTHADGDARFLELRVHADTVWLMPEYCLGLVIYRALVPLNTPDGKDINALYARYEAQDDIERPAEYYLNACLQAMLPQTFGTLPDPAELTKTYAQLDSAGLREKIREQRQMFTRLLEDNHLDEAALRTQLAANPHTRKLAEAMGAMDGHYTLTGFLDQIEGLLESLDEGAPDAAHRAAVPDLNAALPPAARTAPEAPSTPVHPQTDPALQDDVLGVRHRQTVLNRIAAGASCGGLDLSQANLAGLDLAGVDFSGALLAGANFAGAQLQGANLQQAYLPAARLDAANLSGARLTQASLDGASFSGAMLKGAVLDGSACAGVNFSGTDLSGVSLRQATLTHAWIRQVDATRLQADGADFSHANLDGINLSHASLNHADFTGARLRRATLNEANCTATNFTQADMSNASLSQCDLSGSQSTPGTDWRGACLDGAILNGASWMGAALEGAQLRKVKGLHADLSDTRMAHVDASQSDWRQGIFDRADMTHADLSRSNLMDASFSQANLAHCNLTASNLYGAAFMDTVLSGTQLDAANLDNTQLKARLRED